MNPGGTPAPGRGTAAGGRKLPPRIYITVFMGSGKSTAGPLLASALGYRFIDLDAVIEEKEGKSIPALFSERGEKAFRAIEKRELALLEAREDIVVATGGGVLTEPESFDVIHSAGALVYLRVDPSVLFQRLSGLRGRPMISSSDGAPLSDDELRQRIAGLLSAREPLYDQADIIVDASFLTPDAIVEELLPSLRALSAKQSAAGLLRRKKRSSQ